MSARTLARRSRSHPTRELPVPVPQSQTRPETSKRKANMSAHRTISHHLFVAAAGSEDQARSARLNRETANTKARTETNALRLELLDYTRPTPNRAIRSLRAIVSAGAT